MTKPLSEIVAKIEADENRRRPSCGYSDCDAIKSECAPLTVVLTSDMDRILSALEAAEAALRLYSIDHDSSCGLFITNFKNCSCVRGLLARDVLAKHFDGGSG